MGYQMGFEEEIFKKIEYDTGHICFLEKEEKLIEQADCHMGHGEENDLENSI